MLLGLGSCDNSIMDVGPKDQLSDQAVFADPGLAQAFLNDMYLGMGHGLHEVTGPFRHTSRRSPSMAAVSLPPTA